MHPAAQTTLDLSFQALKIAATTGVLPGLSLVAEALNTIVDNCKLMSEHRADAIILAQHAHQLYEVFNAQESVVQNTQLASARGDVQIILAKIKDHTSVWVRYNWWQRFRFDAIIASGIKEYTTQLQRSIERFSITADVQALAGIEQVRESVSGIHEKLAKMADDQATLTVLHVASTSPELLEDMSDDLKEYWQQRGHEELSLTRQKINDRPHSSQVEVCGRRMARSEGLQIAIDLMRGLERLQEMIGCPPNLESLNGEVKRLGSAPVYGSVISEIWKGSWLGSRMVAIKSLRNIDKIKERLVKRFPNELRLWRKLKHPNILLFLGVCSDWRTVSIISPWQKNGNILNYCKESPKDCKIPLLLDALQGVKYLHDLHIVHGNLKCSKILISDDETALVCDFQVAKVLAESDIALTQQSVTLQTSTRWQAPEIYAGRPQLASADIWSLSMTMIELFTEVRPFNEYRRESQVQYYITNGEGGRPQRPDGNLWIGNSMWELMEDCWKKEPENRPTIDEVINRLSQINERRTASLAEI